ncbi:MAG: alpha-D-ribose 1-methylphosphonate 5-triphosphate diphosphatase [Polymorphobacter sp.]|uniref:alpha-D-ribose 1-methylphosphonate 5-triphosphate diphosphatase n=1 Tax=Polymorphobacter sp. TaxID=1909290 RepID=UPI003A86355C
MSAILTNARIVTPDGVVSGALAMADGVISAIDEGNSALGFDCEGDWLIPGIIDIHTDNLERHYFPRPGIDWNPVSAAIVHDGLCISVGVTTVYDSLSVGSFGAGESRKADNLHRLVDGLHGAVAAGMLKADHRIHWRCEAPSDVLADWLPPLAERPLTGLYSLMDHTPGQRQYRNTSRFFTMWRKEGLSEDDIAARMAERAERVARNDARNRRFVAAIAHEQKLPLASHDDETVAHIEDAASHGVTIAEFPVTAEAAEAARAHGMCVIMGGPNLIRGGSYSGNVPASALIEAGMHIGFASDYVPRSLLECAFALAGERWGLPMEQAVDTVTGAPARAMGLDDRGALVPGRRGDVVRVRQHQGQVIVRGVWVAGERVG